MNIEKQVSNCVFVTPNCRSSTRKAYFPPHTNKMYGGVEVYFHVDFILELGGGSSTLLYVVVPPHYYRWWCLHTTIGGGASTLL
jgi:hypothetical protein